MTKSKPHIFLFMTFISSLGDGIMLLVVPNGLGLEFNDIRPAVLVWMVPALAMFLSAYTSKIIIKRKRSERKDYALFIAALACFEILTLGLAYCFSEQVGSLGIAMVFIFFYAFMKEGVPKLFYDVQIYRYFCSEKEYSNLVGKSYALQALSYLVCALLSYALLENLSWVSALFIDAVSFLIFAALLWMYGEDNFYDVEERVEQVNGTQVSLSQMLKNNRQLYSVIFLVPLIFGLNALSWNYIPLIADSYNISTISLGVFMLALFKIPGVGLSLVREKIEIYFKKSSLLWFSASVYFILNAMLHIYPSMIVFAFTLLSQSLIIGLFWPTDTVMRSHLNRYDLITLNTYVLKKLAILQFIACLCSLMSYSLSNFSIWILFSFIVIILLSGIDVLRLYKNVMNKYSA